MARLRPLSDQVNPINKTIIKDHLDYVATRKRHNYHIGRRTLTLHCEKITVYTPRSKLI